MEQEKHTTKLEEWIASSSSGTLRRILTGVWVASILGVLGFAVYLTVVGGVNVPEIHLQEGIGDYLLAAGLSFVSQYVDATLGMGYGTTLSALAVTARSEALSCIGGVAGYALMGIQMPWALIAALVVGGVISSVFAAATVKSMPQCALKSVITSVYMFLGALTLWAGVT